MYFIKYETILTILLDIHFYTFSLLNIQIFVFTKNFIIFLFSWEVTTSSNILNFSANTYRPSSNARATNRATIPRQKLWKVSILICSDANYRAFTRAIGSDPSKKKVHTEATRATLEPVRRVSHVCSRGRTCPGACRWRLRFAPARAATDAIWSWIVTQWPAYNRLRSKASDRFLILVAWKWKNNFFLGGGGGELFKRIIRGIIIKNLI